MEEEYGIRLGQNKQPEQISELCWEIGEKETVVAIAWTLSNPTVSSAIIEVRMLSRLDDLERAASLKLDEDALLKLNDVFNINQGRALIGEPAPEAFAW